MHRHRRLFCCRQRSARPRPVHHRRGMLRPTDRSAGGLTPATSALGLGPPLPHLHRTRLTPAHICTGTRLGPVPRLRRDLCSLCAPARDVSCVLVRLQGAARLWRSRQRSAPDYPYSCSHHQYPYSHYSYPCSLYAYPVLSLSVRSSPALQIHRNPPSVLQRIDRSCA